MAKIFADMGYAMHDHQNGAWADGVFPTTFNVDPNGTRGSAALVYLSPEVRRRSNLTVLTETPLERLVIAGGRVEAARFTRGNGESLTVTARQVIVSAGALQSPVVLMRSGIGPGAHLSEHGITVQVDRPGVGENLQEHPNIGVSGYLHPSARLPSREVHHLQALLRYSSNIEGMPPGDMHVGDRRARRLARRWAAHRHTGVLGKQVVLHRPRAAVVVAGQTIRDRLPHAVRSARHGAPEAGVPHRRARDDRGEAGGRGAGRVPERLLAAYPRADAPSTRNAAITAVAAPLMDRSDAIRRKVMNFAVGTEYSAEMLAADDTLLEAHLRRRVNGSGIRAGHAGWAIHRTAWR